MNDETDEKVIAEISKFSKLAKTGKPASPNWGGRRPNSGGRRPGAGRKKGTPNKVTAEIKQLAQKYGPEAIAELARLATQAESEAARVAAIKELLDRGYGRAVQPIEGSMTYGVSEQLAELFRENVNGALGNEIARRDAFPPPNGEKPH
jgi:hypothetical protein